MMSEDDDRVIGSGRYCVYMGTPGTAILFHIMKIFEIIHPVLSQVSSGSSGIFVL